MNKTDKFGWYLVYIVGLFTQIDYHRLRKLTWFESKSWKMAPNTKCSLTLWYQSNSVELSLFLLHIYLREIPEKGLGNEWNFRFCCVFFVFESVPQYKYTAFEGTIVKNVFTKMKEFLNFFLRIRHTMVIFNFWKSMWGISV